jgi:hypothetical protein
MFRTGNLISVRPVRLIAKEALVVLVITIWFLGSLLLMASGANAQEPRTVASMAALKEKTAKLGAPKIEGEERIGGKSVPVLYFGSTKMNNDFTVVDEVSAADPGMNATLFVKAGVPLEQHEPIEEYIRVAMRSGMPQRPSIQLHWNSTRTSAFHFARRVVWES